jgi:hypothetical protein
MRVTGLRPTLLVATSIAVAAVILAIVGLSANTSSAKTSIDCVKFPDSPKCKRLQDECKMFPTSAACRQFDQPGETNPNNPDTGKSCKSGQTEGTVGGKEKCLKRGQRCKRKYQSDYKQAGFKCKSKRKRNGKRVYKLVKSKSKSKS